MVYLRQHIQESRRRLSQNQNIEWAAYLAITSPLQLGQQQFELTPDEQVSLKGYMRSEVDSSVVKTILNRPKIKGMDATSNIYKFAGLYLADSAGLKTAMDQKFKQSDLKQKYFIAKLEPVYGTALAAELKTYSREPIATAVKQIIGVDIPDEKDLNDAIIELSKMDADIQLQILLEDLEAALLKIRYMNKPAEEVIRDILYHFSNAVQKITKDRRKDHFAYVISDEYDVQDILYVILKSVFPTLRDEDPIPKVGAKSTKIDLILREENILIEVKMIKTGDSNETHFIEQLKVDFESYHECKWLSKLFCFVWDPFKKTRDVANFRDLNGSRTKGGHVFDVEVIVQS